jgi:molybdate transport system substrate-binding protein
MLALPSMSGEFAMLRVVLLSLLVCTQASAGEIRVLVAGAFKAVVVAAQPDFERESGHRLSIDNGTTGQLAARIMGGEAFDVAIVPPALLAELRQKGLVAPGGGNLAEVGIGVAVKAGAVSPDISTVAAFRAAVLATPRLAMIDPASGGSSGVYLAKLFAAWGIAEALRPKLVLVPGGYVAEKLADGSADLALHQISEILPVAGVTLVGPLPAEIQSVTVYASAVGAKASDPASAQALLEWLMGPKGRAILALKGMQPPR